MAIEFLKRLRYVGLFCILLVGLIVIIGTGGGDGGEDESFRNLNGAWVGPCTPKDDAYAWEKLVFYEQTGEMAYMYEEFQTNDCTDNGTTGLNIRGSYNIGNEIECSSGIYGKCSELDILLDNDQNDYRLYSIDASKNPHQLYFSESSDDQASRPKDVQLIPPYYKVLKMHYFDSDGDGYGRA